MNPSALDAEVRNVRHMIESWTYREGWEFRTYVLTERGLPWIGIEATSPRGNIIRRSVNPEAVSSLDEKWMRWFGLGLIGDVERLEREEDFRI